MNCASGSNLVSGNRNINLLCFPISERFCLSFFPTDHTMHGGYNRIECTPFILIRRSEQIIYGRIRGENFTL